MESGRNEFEVEFNTIHESVGESIWRDLRVVFRRMGLVFIPGISSLRAELNDWELWGPLFICMSLSVILCLEAKDEASTVFTVVFLVVWVGSAIVTLNAQLLGARISFFQTVCLLGYCEFPILLSAALCILWNHVLSASLAVVLRFVSVAIAVSWSTLAAATFLSDTNVPPGKLGLSLYPVLLFFLALGWMVLIGFQQHHTNTASPPSSIPPTPALSSSTPTP